MDRVLVSTLANGSKPEEIFRMTSEKRVRSVAIRVVGLAVICMTSPAWSQPAWQTCGSNLCSSAGANVGIGTTSPGNKLQVGDNIIPAGGYGLAVNSALYGGWITTNNTGALGFGVANNSDGSTAGNPAFAVYNNPGSGVVEKFRVQWNGNVGIGTTNPPAKLEVDTAYNVPSAPALRVNGWIDMNSSACGLAAIGSNTYLSNDNNFYYSNTHGSAGATAIMFRDCGSDYQAIKFLTGSGATTANAPASMTERMRITSAGNIGIGTAVPQYKLSVNGTIGTKEVVVTNTGWADYVFKPDYRPMPLSEVSSYIEEHHHLPGIPSESEVEKKGVSLGDMQVKLLAKIEELTLHMIQAEEKTERLEKQNRELQERVSRFEGWIIPR
jgi:hypothetical protein